jgi:hypothetical protein
MVAELGKASQIGSEQIEVIWREIGQHLQNARSRLDEPFAVVASRAELKPTDLAAMERGEIKPSAKELQCLLGALKTGVMDFIGDLSLEARLVIMDLFEPEPEGPSQKPESSLRVAGDITGSDLLTHDASSTKDASHAGGQLKRQPQGWGIAREQGQITYFQMHACLRGLFKRTDRERAEIIYSWTSPADIDVKVFTSIDARTGLARPIGEDAIRIVVYDKRAKRKIVAWSFELKRVGNWQVRLREKAGSALLCASYRPHCPACRQDTVIIFGRNEAQFWGCSNYPKCLGILDLEFGERPSLPRSKVTVTRRE